MVTDDIYAFCRFVVAGLKDVVDEVEARCSLVCVIITSQSEHSLHPSLTVVQGSHFIQGFVNIQSPDQVSIHTFIHTHTLGKTKNKEEK